MEGVAGIITEFATYLIEVFKYIKEFYDKLTKKDA